MEQCLAGILLLYHGKHAVDTWPLQAVLIQLGHIVGEQLEFTREFECRRFECAENLGVVAGAVALLAEVARAGEIYAAVVGVDGGGAVEAHQCRVGHAEVVVEGA